jgi:ammonium transporter, Amt family
VNPKLILGGLAVTIIIWVAYGNGAVFGDPLVPGLLGDPGDSLGLASMLGVDSGGALAPDLGGLANAGFQLCLALVAVTVIAATVQARVRFAAWLIFVGAWVSLVYLPVAYWVFNPNGWAMALGVTDLAGGTVVQIGAGAAALALLLRSGKRAAVGETAHTGDGDPLLLLGVGLLWMGWLGMTAGSEAAVDGTAALIWVNTMVAPAAGILAWLIEQRLQRETATPLGAACGAVSGLVAITPACGILSPLWAMVLGLIAGAVCSAATRMGRRSGFGESFAVVGIHLVGGLLGVLFIGVAGSAIGFIYNGSLASLVAQVAAAFGVAGYSFAMALLLAFVLEKTVGFSARAEATTASVSARNPG